jgi:hypothetical protein
MSYAFKRLTYIRRNREVSFTLATDPTAPLKRSSRIKPRLLTNSKAVHEPAEICLRGFYQHMEMIAHQCIAVQFHPKGVDAFLQCRKEFFSILIVLANGGSFVSSAGDVIPGSWILNSQ